MKEIEKMTATHQNREPSETKKQNIVDAILMMERAQIIDFNGHFSARVGNTENFMINSAGSSRSSLTVEDIITIDLDGKLVEGNAPPPMEFHIHAEIYRRRPDVHAVAHTHPLWSTVLSIAGHKLRPVIMQAAVLGEICSFPKISSINTPALAREMADALGHHRIVTLQSHGAVVAAEGILEAFVLAAYLEETAQRQFLASQIGQPVVLTQAEIEVIGRNLWKPHLLQKVWDYHKGKMTAAR
jgi:ribulose-5-phosphate 4-epimerase/fuculose-1-phosphate aldolase